jgi:DNA-binding MarR family transcriptional regulator
MWINLMRIKRHLQRVVERRLKRVGLPPLVWHDALLLLASQPNGELPALDMEQKLSLRQYQISRLVDHLAEGGLISRRRLTGAGRPVQMRLTARGRDLQQRMAEVYASTVDTEITGQFSQQEAADIIALLNHLFSMCSEKSGEENSHRSRPGQPESEVYRAFTELSGPTYLANK